jgi:hypothetical protein
MKTLRMPSVALVGACAVAVALGVRAVHGADDDAVKPVAKVHDVMVAVNGEGGLVELVGAALKKGEIDDEGWDSLQARSAMIAEAGNLLLGLKPPRGADTPEGLAAWKKRAVEYRGCGEAIRDAAAKKDAPGATAALAGLRKRCAECHKEHKPPE